jgi:hypothetical protein
MVVIATPVCTPCNRSLQIKQFPKINYAYSTNCCNCRASDVYPTSCWCMRLLKYGADLRHR